MNVYVALPTLKKIRVMEDTANGKYTWKEYNEAGIYKTLEEAKRAVKDYHKNDNIVIEVYGDLNVK